MTRQAFAVELGKLLREMRDAVDMKQGDVAAGLGVGVSTLANWENGRAGISGYNLRRLKTFYRKQQAEKMKALAEVAR